MGRLNVSLDLERKLLSVDGDSLELNSSLVGARVRVMNDSKSKDLYLIYNSYDNSSNDYKRLGCFIKSIGETDIRLYHHLYDEENGGRYPMIILDGNIKINISA